MKVAGRNFRPAWVVKKRGLARSSVTQRGGYTVGGREVRRISEREQAQYLDFGEKVGGAKHDAGFEGRYRAETHDGAVREVYDGTCGELVVTEKVGGGMNLDVYATHGDKATDRLGDVLTPEGLWIEVRTREFQNGVFGFQGDDPRDATWDVGALVQVVEWGPGPRKGKRGLPIAVELVGFASIARIRAFMYQMEFPAGLHWVVDPDKFQPWEPVRDFLVERRSGRRSRG